MKIDFVYYPYDKLLLTHASNRKQTFHNFHKIISIFLKQKLRNWKNWLQKL